MSKPHGVWQELRTALAPVYIPALLFGTGLGTLLAVTPAMAYERGTGLAIATLASAAYLAVEVVFELPAGYIVKRLGERIAMLLATLVALAGVAGVYFVHSPIFLLVGAASVGAATAVFNLARQAYLTVHIAYEWRARALSLMVAMFRIGMFVGPLGAAALIQLGGGPASALVFCLTCQALAAVILTVARSTADGKLPPVDTTRKDHNVFGAIAMHRRALMRIGFGAATLMSLKTSRMVILPAWAVALGIDPSVAALIIGISNAIDVATLYVSGWAMDKFGRRKVAIPTLTGLALSHLLLAGLWWTDQSTLAFIAVATLMALANAASGGVVATIGSDLAPRQNPIPFLAAWRFTTSLGTGTTSVAIPLLTAVASINVAAGVLGGIALCGAATLYKQLPREQGATA